MVRTLKICIYEIILHKATPQYLPHLIMSLHDVQKLWNHVLVVLPLAHRLLTSKEPRKYKAGAPLYASIATIGMFNLLSTFGPGQNDPCRSHSADSVLCGRIKYISVPEWCFTKLILDISNEGSSIVSLCCLSMNLNS